MAKIIRKPAAAGRFYPRFKQELIQTIHEEIIDNNFGLGKELDIKKTPAPNPNSRRKVIGGVCPHAGYVYSASAAAHTIQAISNEGFPDTIIILGTQHTGYYHNAVMSEGEWQTPFGNVEIDTEFAKNLLKKDPQLHDDPSAFNGYPHGREHNIEVQIPLLQYAAVKAEKKFKIVPIKVGHMEARTIESLANAISDTYTQFLKKEDIAIIASSDMTHYEPHDIYNAKKEIERVQNARDLKVIEEFKKGDWISTYKAARETTVCGPQTIATLLCVGKKLGASNYKALKYYNSFQKSGEQIPCNYSVGYFSGIVEL